MTVPSSVMVPLASLVGPPVQPGQAHVQNLDHAAGRQQQVVRLDVAVDQAALAGVLQAQRRLPAVVARLVHGQRAVLLDELGQVGRPGRTP